MAEAFAPARYAQTFPALYQQLHAARFSLDALIRVRDAYWLTTRLFTTRQQSSGKCFVAHAVGTASIVAAMGRPTSIVIAGLLHNAYRAGDFGDGATGATATRRAMLRGVIGDDAEQQVARFATLPWRRAFADYAAQLATLDRLDVAVLHIRVADVLEHLLDLGPTLGDEQEQGFVRRAPAVAAVAAALGHADVADDIRGALAAILAAPPLGAASGRGYPRLCTPRSYRRRRLLALRRIFRGRGFAA